MPELGSAFYRIYAETKQFTRAIRKAEKDANDSTTGISKSLRGMDRDIQKSNKQMQGLGDTYTDVKDDATGLQDGMFALGRAARHSRRDVDDHEKSQSRLSRTLTAVRTELKKNSDDHDSLGKNIGRTTKEIFKLNQAITLTKHLFGLLKFPAIIAGVGYLASALTTATAGLVAFTSALGPAVGILGSAPQSIGVLVQSLITLKLGFSGVKDAMKDSMKEFSKPGPAAQKFGSQLSGLLPHLKEFRNDVQAAFLPKVWQGLTSATKNFSTFKSVFAGSGAALGNVIKQLGEFAGSKAFGSDFAKIGASNNKIIAMMGPMLVNVAKAMTNIAIVARPMTEWLAKVAKGWTDTWVASTQAGRESGKMAAFFEKTRTVLTHLGNILGNVWKSLLNIGHAGSKLGGQMLEDLDALTLRWKKWTGSVTGQNAMSKYFADAKKPLYEFFGLTSDLVKMFFRVGQANTGPLADLFKQIRSELLPVMEELLVTTTKSFGPPLVSMLVQLTKSFALLAGSNGPLTAMVKGITAVSKAFNYLLENVPGMRDFIFVAVGMWGAFKATQMLGAITGITKLGKAIFGLTTMGKNVAAKGGLLKYIGLGTVGWIAGIAAAAAGIYLLYTKCKTFRDIVNAVAGAVKTGLIAAFNAAKVAVGAIASAFTTAYNAVKTAINAVINEVSQWKVLIAIVKTAFDVITGYFKMTFEIWKAIFSVGFAVIKAIVTAGLAVIKTVFNAVWPAITTVVKVAWSGIKNIISGALNILKGIFNVFTGIFRGDFGRMWTGIKQIFSGALSAIVGIVKIGVAPIIGAGKLIWDGLKAGASAVWGAIKSIVSGGLNAVKSIITGVFGAFKSLGSSLIENIGKGMSAAWRGVKSVFTSAVNGVIGIAESFLNAILDVVNRIPFVNINGGKNVHIPRIGKGGSNGPDSGGTVGAGGTSKTLRDGVGGVQRRKQGGPITSPVVMMGEEAPRHHEWVIATNPAYKRDNIRYWMAAGHDLGMPGFVKGGLPGLGGLTDAANFIGDAGSAVGNTVASGAKGVAGGVASAGKFAYDKASDLVKGLIGMLPGNPFSEDPMKQFGSGILNKAKEFIFGSEGVNTLGKMIGFADAISAKGWPYKYGGGHGSFAGPYDCSGYVSAILHAGGLLDSPLDTVGLRGALEPGEGKYVTVGVRGGAGKSGHTMMRIGGIPNVMGGGAVSKGLSKVGIQTAKYYESGSGHGAKSVGGWSGRFDMYHPKGFAKGGYFGKYGSGVTVKSKKADSAQKKVLGRALELAQRWKVGPKATKALIEAIITESDARNLTYGDRDSLGILQGRQKYHKKSDLMDIDYQIGAFLGHGRGGKATKYKGFTGAGNARTLAKNKKLSAGNVAQKVQGSAFPEAYGKNGTEAAKIIKLYKKANKKKAKPKGSPKKAAQLPAMQIGGAAYAKGKKTPVAMSSQWDSVLNALYANAQSTIDTKDDLNWWTIYLNFLKTNATSLAGMKARGDSNFGLAYGNFWQRVSGLGDMASGLAGLGSTAEEQGATVRGAISEIISDAGGKGIAAPPSVTALTAAPSQVAGAPEPPEWLDAEAADAEADNLEEPTPPKDDAPQSEWDKYYADYAAYTGSYLNDQIAAQHTIEWWESVLPSIPTGTSAYATARRAITEAKKAWKQLDKLHYQQPAYHKPTDVTNADGSITNTDNAGNVTTTKPPPLPSVVTFGEGLPTNVASGVVTPGGTGTVNVQQYFTKAPTDPYAWLRSSEWAARAVFTG